MISWLTTAAILSLIMFAPSVVRAEREFIVIARPGSEVGNNYIRRFDDYMPGPKINDHGVVVYSAQMVGLGWSVLTQHGIVIAPGDRLTNGWIVSDLGSRVLEINLSLNNQDDVFVTGAQLFDPATQTLPTGAILNHELVAHSGEMVGDYSIHEFTRWSAINDAGDTLFQASLRKGPPDEDGRFEQTSAIFYNNSVAGMAGQEIQGRSLTGASQPFFNGEGGVVFQAQFEDDNEGFSIVSDNEIIFSPGDTVQGEVIEQPRLFAANASGTLLLGDSAEGPAFNGSRCCGNRFFTQERELLTLPDEVDRVGILGFNASEQVLYGIDGHVYLDDELIVAQDDVIAGETTRDLYDFSINNRGDVVFLAEIDDEWDIRVVVSTDRPGNGDLNTDATVDQHDIDLLATTIRSNSVDYWFDVNRDGIVSFADHTAWVRDKRKTWFGDANLDGEFNSSDLVAVFRAGQYEDDIVMNSGWAQGDWDGDGDFTTSDLVAAFQDGGFEQGPRVAANAVPEPESLLMLITAMFVVATVSRIRRSRFDS